MSIIINAWLIGCLFQFSVFGQSLNYNKHYTIACHNCYEEKDNRKIEDVFKFTTTIEIDIWDNSYLSGMVANVAKSTKMDGDWYVKHRPDEKGNINCCGGTLGDCLKRLNTWSDKNPGHPVITIFLDKKENWSDANENRNPLDLDKLISSIFTRKKLYKPIDLLAARPNLKAAMAANCPELNSLKGKFIFVITDGSTQLNIPMISTPRTPLNEYLTERSTNGVCFVAPQISTENEILNPAGFSLQNKENIIFYNLAYEHSKLATVINAQSFLSRVFGSPETLESCKTLVNDKVNFIAVDDYKIKL